MKYILILSILFNIILLIIYLKFIKRYKKMNNQITLDDLKACVETITTRFNEEPDADEMFAKLGYKKVEKDFYIEYINSNIDEQKITIDKQTKPFYRYMKSMYDNLCAFTPEDEDRAIHKKIRELKILKV